ncbi:amino acid adenylation domain-containing protein, partial [Flavitalea sp. BT771]|uniref:non-ribosomal peptide synthetase n=1 Tax=Flavitalea sp. BT771 TaxID=3063329 RepID=UPI0026E45F4B
MKNIQAFLNEIRINAGAIWLQNGSIKLFASSTLQHEEVRVFILNNKTEIVSILNENCIFSKEKFISTIIFRNSGITSYRLTSAQERLWFIEQYERGTNAYHSPVVYELSRETDLAGVKYALQQIGSRHHILRSRILQGDHETTQELLYGPLTIEEIYLTDKDDYISIIRNDINCPFDLSAKYPIRVVLYQIQSDSPASAFQISKRLLLVNVHHIAFDGWSGEIFLKELFGYYEAYANNDAEFDLPMPEIQYRDYALWQRSYLTGEVLQKQLDYWKDKLSGYSILELPTDYARPNQMDYTGRNVTFTLNKSMSERLRFLARQYRVTLHSVLLSSVNILLSKYTGQQDIVTGGPIANRHHWQTEGLIGFFANTHINRTLLHDTQSYEELIRQVYQDQIDAQLYQELPFERLVEELGVERDPSRHPVFQVLFSLQRFESQSVADVKRHEYFTSCEEVSFNEIAKFDLSIIINDAGEELTGQFNYATSLFHKNTIDSMVKHYVYLLEQLMVFPQMPYGAMSLLHTTEYNQIVYEWNRTEKAYRRNETLPELFEEQVMRTPGAVALVFEGRQLTYGGLNEKANQLARHIRKRYREITMQELKADTLIALCVERSLELVIGILAVLKAGGAYVPIDPSYPAQRIGYMLDDTAAALVLTQRDLQKKVNLLPSEEKLLYIDLDEALYQGEALSNLSRDSSCNLAYVLYTSGTSGHPKGVMVEHRAVASLVYNDYVEVTENDVFAFLSSPVFDAATFELWTPLLNGSSLVIPGNLHETISDIDIFREFLTVNEVSILWLTKSLFDSLLHLDTNIFSSLHYMIIGGEALDKATVNKLIESNCRPHHFLNGYGPTESTTFTCTYRLETSVTASSVPIGKPINNRQVYVLDKQLQPVPIGVTGELYIGGAGLARGYLNNALLTSERFIQNPFATEKDTAQGHTRLYRTGDLVRWLPGGELAYLGRNDEQVKLRGYRIELGEIEAAMNRVAGVRQSCVVIKERATPSGSTKYLVGYYVADGKVTAEALSAEISAELPEYMVPAALVGLESFPLTVNGKLDRRALSNAEPGNADEYVAPVTDSEKAVCKIWEELLGLERVSVTDDFFRIGGTSILAIQVSHRMNKIFKCEIMVADVFRYKTIVQLLANCKNQPQIHIPELHDNLSLLSFAQERLWFIEQYEGRTTGYHMPAVFELDTDIGIEAVKYAIQHVVLRHEILRSTIEHGGQQQSMQMVHEEPLRPKEIRLTDKDDIESLVNKEISCPFDLSREYPIRVIFYKIFSESHAAVDPPEKVIVLFNLHHIASDGWSMEIFQKELWAYYQAYITSDLTFSLPKPEIQYNDYAQWQRSYLSGGVMENQLNYWKSKLSGYQTLELPTDYSRPGQKSYSGNYQPFILNNDLSQRLRSLMNHYGTTLHTIILSSVNILLSKYTGQQDIVIGSPTANRHHRQTAGLIGFFVNMQVNRTLLNNEQSFEELIHQVHQEQIAAQLHQDIPFEKLVEELEIDRDSSRHPIFQVTFVAQSFEGDKSARSEREKYFRPFKGSTAYCPEKFDLSIVVNDSQQEITGQFSYATSLFHGDTIGRMAEQYIYLLEQLTSA